MKKIDTRGLALRFFAGVILAGLLSAISGSQSSYVTHNILVPQTNDLNNRLAAVFAFLTVGVIAQGIISVISSFFNNKGASERSKEKERKTTNAKVDFIAILSAICSSIGLIFALYVFQVYQGALVIPIYVALPVIFVVLGDTFIRKIVNWERIFWAFLVILTGLIMISISRSDINFSEFLPIVILTFAAIMFAIRQHLDQVGRNSTNSFEFANKRIIYLSFIATFLSLIVVVALNEFSFFSNLIFQRILNPTSSLARFAVIFILLQQFLGWTQNQITTWAKGYESVTSVNILSSATGAIFGFVIGLAVDYFTNGSLGGSNQDWHILLVNGLGALLLALGLLILPIKPQMQEMVKVSNV